MRRSKFKKRGRKSGRKHSSSYKISRGGIRL